MPETSEQYKLRIDFASKAFRLGPSEFLLQLFEDEEFFQEFLSQRQRWLQTKKATEEPKK